MLRISRYHALWVLLSLNILFIFILSFLSSWSLTSESLVPEKVQWLDGDTLKLPNGENLRLAGIDAPENGQPLVGLNRDAGKLSLKCAQLVWQKLVQKGFRMRLHLQKRDHYGRWLGDITYASSQNRQRHSLSLKLIQAGCAGFYPWSEEARSVIFERLRAQSEAQWHHRGLWQFGGYLRPREYRRKKSSLKKSRLKS
jgi:endonuclease YncB( thermonuclease family)